VATKQLSERSRSVLILLTEGHSNKEIAAALRITEGAVKWHVSRLLLTYDCTSRTGLVRAAIARGDLEVARPH